MDGGLLPLVFFLFFSSGLGGLTVSRGAILNEYYVSDAFGKLLGIIMGVSSIGGIFGPIFVGMVFDTMKLYSYVWIFLHY